MKKTVLFVYILLFLLLPPTSASLKNLAFGRHNEKVSLKVSPSLSGIRISQPLYVRLQALQEGSVIFRESIPQNFQDHVATINASVLAVFVSTNAQSIDMHSDEVGNLWLAVNYTLRKGDYLSTLTWVSSKTVSSNHTIPESVSFPESYPNEIKPFLNPGRKMPVDNTTIKELAETYATQDMIETVQNILSFLNETQTYDREKIRLFMSGKLNTTDILNFLNDPLESLETGNSFCFERALLAATILRAAGIPTRTFTNSQLKTWIQVWLPETGWVDAEVFCAPPQQLRFPRPLTFDIPWLIENSSDTMFPFAWFPEISMRVASLNFSNVEDFNIDEYGTVLSQPVDIEIYKADPDKFSFPIVFEPEIVHAALTRNETDLVLHLSKGEKTMSKSLILGETNSIEFEGLSVSFIPDPQGELSVLRNFTVKELWVVDIKILLALVAVVPVILIVWFYWKRKRVKL